MKVTRTFTRRNGSKFELEFTVFPDVLAESLAREMNQKGLHKSKRIGGGVVALLRDL